MKIAYKEKNIIKSQGPEWEYCDGCIFNMENQIIEGKIPDIWPCDLFHPNCRGYDVYRQLKELDEIFKI